MPRPTNVLKSLTISREMKPGLHRDGGGLYLQVGRGGNKSWIFRYMIAGKPREMGLGSLQNVSLADARDKAIDCRRLIGEGKDPLDVRNADKAVEQQEKRGSTTFEEAAAEYIALNRAKWSSAKHAAQWKATLDTYAMPIMGKVAVSAITPEHVRQVLAPIWTTKTETATRLRGRIEVILDAAEAKGQRTGDNPARLKTLQHRLPALPKGRGVVHHAALPYTSIFSFIESVRLSGAVAAKALEFAILTAARTGEVIGAKFSEFDLDEAVWMVPAERMKAGKQHRVPLSARAVTIVRVMEQMALGEFVFPGQKPNRPMSNMAMLQLLGRMDHGDLTVHGFRSTFRDWAAEKTEYPNELVEMALAHTIKSKVEAAYRRGDMLERRRTLMDDWAAYCQSKAV